MAKDRPDTDEYSILSNEELYQIICRILPHMRTFLVTDQTRQTVIAMLKITQHKEL